MPNNKLIKLSKISINMKIFILMIKIENAQLEDKVLIKIIIILRKISKEQNLMKEIELWAHMYRKISTQIKLLKIKTCSRI